MSKEKTKRRICILGSAPSSKDLAPFDDETVEFWTLAFRTDKAGRSARIFEMHEPAKWRAEVYPEGAMTLVKRFGDKPIVTTEPIDAIPNNIVYPLEAANEFLVQHGGESDYFTSSIGYMLVMAIMEEPDEIMLYGVDMMDATEYGYQRSNTEWILGIAAGRGIKVTVPRESALLKCQVRYGLQSFAIDQNPLTLDYLERRAAKIKQDNDDARSHLNMCLGAQNATEKILSLLAGEDAEQNVAAFLAGLNDEVEQRKAGFQSSYGAMIENQTMIDYARLNKMGGKVKADV